MNMVERATMLSPRPRCAMGIDAAGETLYLLTADGYQPGYSEGITMLEAGQLLRGLGVIDAMACDEGGSAMMYLGSRRGLVSRPPHVEASDEPPDRPTYTSFSISR
jgi:exopolysaccharide biosynthesis protein